MNAHYINLDHREDRKILMEQNWKGLVNLHRFPAIKNDIGLHGVYESHYSVIKMLHDRNEPMSIIMEDDVIPCKDFNDRLNLFMKDLPTDWDIFMLGFFSTERSKFDNVSGHIYRAKDRICGGQCYIVNPKCYEKILSKFDNKHYGMNLDVLLLDVQKTENVYLSIPTFTYQYNSYSDNSNSDSSIVSEATKVYFKDKLC